MGNKICRHGSLSDKGVKLLAQALESVQDLTNFSLDIYRGDWHVTDEGIIRLRDAIQKLTKLISLRLNLRGQEKNFFTMRINFGIGLKVLLKQVSDTLMRHW